MFLAKLNLEKLFPDLTFVIQEYMKRGPNKYLNKIAQLSEETGFANPSR
jgi:hypothetical protein